MIDEKNVALQIFGCLLKDPSIIGQTDKYILTPNDFSTSFEKRLFGCIYNLYERGAHNLGIVDIDNYLKDTPATYKLWEKEKGIEYLQDAEELSDLDNFPYYYRRLKAINAVKSLKRLGINTSSFYEENRLNPDAEEINKKFDELTAEDIFRQIKVKITQAENEIGITNANKVSKANQNVKELLAKLKVAPDIGGRLQGKYFNTIVRGARKGKFYIRSASSGTGKTRSMVGDACYLAYPIRYSKQLNAWEWAGACEKVLMIVTEQNDEEVQTMILSYLTGINEEVILSGQFSKEQEHIIDQAIEVMDYYQDNFVICQMPTPNIEQVKNKIHEMVLLNKVEYIFYDYIQSTPALLNEFRDLKVREDVVLGMMSAALKDLAVELDVFIMSATQTNAQIEGENRGIRNESVVRGARSIIDKADMACVMARPTDDELHVLEAIIPNAPNVVTDIYKMRRGRYTQVRIWSYTDLGTCRREDLVVTNGKLVMVPVENLKQQYKEDDFDICINIDKLNANEPLIAEPSNLEIVRKVETIKEQKNDIFYGLLDL